MLTPAELESMRRSQAMAPLSATQVSALIDTCDALLREREQIAAIVGSLPTSFTAVRSALNHLHRILR